MICGYRLSSTFTIPCSVSPFFFLCRELHSPHRTDRVRVNSSVLLLLLLLFVGVEWVHV